ncbi:MAG: TonB-dependent receptor, partial [Bacteroidales bacterium]|nr:TonB-dependent receptor [Bacteroidales bacterium]
MKKYILLLSILTIASFSGYSQNMYDALRYSQLYYEGTARSMGLGNAMVSLGGDLGALSYNPAASGVYRY